MQTTTEPRQPELLSADEMRAILGIGRSAFYDLARKDELPVPTLRIGRRLMFSRRQVEAVLNRRHDDSMDTMPERATA
ncbi:MAG: helix-turn-helix domain-containing protein [Chloroflexota bacterium]|nr:helix-turn-helix domain-containing protein [Chloroflexota bacterium]